MALYQVRPIPSDCYGGLGSPGVQGLLKVGQTTREVKQRVAEQVKTAAIKNYKRLSSLTDGRLRSARTTATRSTPPKLQPFLSYTNHPHTTLDVGSRDHLRLGKHRWSVAVIPQVGQLFKLGPWTLQLTLGARYWAEAPEKGPEGWALRVQLTLMFPQ